MLRTRIRFAVRRYVRRVTPLTWLIWALLVSDLAAPGYLKFHCITTQFDAIAFVENALADR
ncbi:MAG: hypothetical protein AAGJ80_00030 [Cyanobacteria bacterium J06553_1]